VDSSLNHQDFDGLTCLLMKITALNFLEHPPPLPPRLPVRPGSALGTPDNSKSADNSKNLAKSEHSHSSSKNSNQLTSESSCKLKKLSKSESSTYDQFTQRHLDCSTPSTAWQGSQASHVTSTPKEVADVDKKKIKELKAKRAELISSLQTDERERQWHYTQLELISQKIRGIPLTSAQSYSLENELQRQQLEERAARVQASMLGTLGKPEEAIAKRRSRVQAISTIDTQLASFGERMDESRDSQSGGAQSRPPPSEMRASQSTARSVRQPQSCNLEQLYHEALPLDKALSHSGPPAFGTQSLPGLAGEETASVISFTSSVHSLGDGGENWRQRESELDCRVEAANSLMSLLGCTDVDKMSRTLLAMSSSPANCDMMRSSRCIPLLVQLLHIDPSHPDNPRPARPVRARAARSLHNIVHAHPSDKHCKREAKVLKLLEVLRQYCDFLRDVLEASVGSGVGKMAVKNTGCKRVSIQVVEGGEKYAEQDLMVCDFGECDAGSGKHVFACHNFLDYSGEARKSIININIEETMAILTRCSFDESHRQPIFLLGGIPALAELIQVENRAHSPTGPCHQCREVRRYAVVALTNLTFGNASIKSYLCSFPGFVEIMVGQLDSNWENLRKATAHLFRNLAWKADKSSKSVLSESKVVSVLMMAAMSVSARSLVETPMGSAVEPGRDEPTLKVILSALWNLSAHCRKNKSDVCGIIGSLIFLVQLLRSRSTAVVENGGGILRNVSSYIATSQQGEEYRKILREENCLSLLLSQLRSPSLTIVSNACGTLWNFSARSASDQEALWELGAVPMLQSLTNSKHKTISTCSLAALKNLYTARPAGLFMMVSGAGQTGQLTARKVKNMVADLDEKLSDCGGRDVEGGSPQDSPNGSDNDSGSEGEVNDKEPVAVRSESQNSLSSNPSLTSNNSQRNSRSPEGSGRKVLFLKGIADVAKQNGTSMESLGKALPSCYGVQPPYQNVPQPRSGYNTDTSRHSSDSPPPPIPKRGDGGRGSLSAEGRFEGHFTSYIKQNSTEYKLPSKDNYLESDGERVMSPSKLVLSSGSASALSPASTPLDLTKKKPKFGDHPTDDTETCEEKPTDYSLRFQESEEPELLASKDPKSEQLFDDTVKTYCTEGTPMDTPFIFSTATSMNDLREPAIAEEDEQIETKLEQNVDSTVAYAVEGTPLTFSRAESLSDLEDIEGTGDGGKLSAIPESKEEKAMNETAGEKREESNTPPPKDAKTVTFRGNEESSNPQRNPHETPMMFSRASSIASLDSFDQQSLHDGYSSYEASRATSGRVSPSDLPDSPSQTMPGSPHHGHASTNYSNRNAPGQNQSGPPRPMKNFPPLASTHKKPMFDDGIKSYQEEGTPAVFSTRTSLSGLEFDDEDVNPINPEVPDNDKSSNMSEDEDIYADSESLLGQLIHSAMPNSKPVKSRLPKPKQAWTRNTTESPKLNESGAGASDDSCCSAENQDILDACIASAMPSKPAKETPRTKALGPRQAAEGAPADPTKQKKKSVSPPKVTTKPITRVPPPPPERRGSHLSHPCVAAAAAAAGDLKFSGVIPKEQFRQQQLQQHHNSHTQYRGDYGPDQPRAYRVEDTPLNFSAATSLSDLTVDEPQSGRLSVDSADGLIETRQGRRGFGRAGHARSMPPSGGETPMRFMTEGTPAVFSRNDSLSSLDCDEESVAESHFKGGPVQSRNSKLSSANVSSPGSFQSHLPRPSAVGRSGSSGSSTGASEKPISSNGPSKPDRAWDTPQTKDKSFNSSLSSLSIESLNNTNPDEEDLLADCISSAMPKSKSEHFDLSGKSKKSKKSPQREKSKSSEREFCRSNSKSPKNSRLIPGLVIPGLKLNLRSSPPKSMPLSHEVQQTPNFEIGNEKSAVRNESTRQPRPLSTEYAQKSVSEALVSLELTASTDTANSLSSSSMWDQSPNCTSPAPITDTKTKLVPNLPTLTTKSMEITLTQSRVSELEMQSLTQSGLKEAGLVAQSMMVDASLTSSGCSEALDYLGDIGPPSIMLDSLPSLTQPASLPVVVSLPHRRPSMPEEGKLHCRHTVSGKMGSTVPLAVRRALGGSGLGSLSAEDLSSMSSCHSNIDNIMPPTMMDDMDMDNSMVSVASISSEVAAALAGSGGSDDTSASLTSEAIREIVMPVGQAVEAFEEPSICFDNFHLTHASISQDLDQVCPPTVMEDMTLTQDTITLKPNHGAAATYTVGVEDGGDTIADVADAFDEESVVEPTLTAGSDAVECDIPDLPRDSRGTTPAQSGGESSVETTPIAKRKLSPKERRQADRERYLTFTKSNESSPKKNDAESSGQNFRQARLLDDERFRTRTITKEDLSSPGSSPEKGSPKSIKQRRAEEAERFLTHTITPADLKAEAREESLTVQEVALLESEARLVVQTITERKAEAKSRSASLDILANDRSRSASVEILKDHEMTRLDADSCLASRENLLDRDESQDLASKPRICKPWESRVLQEDDSPPKGIRGRRRALYSPPMKRATIPPPVAPKPTLSTRPRTSSSPVTSPRLVRGTRATQLRQINANKTSGSVSSTSPKSSPRSINSPRSLNSTSSSLVSPRSLTSPHLRGNGSPNPPASRGSPDRRYQSPVKQEKTGIVRQGTFTKDDDSNSNSNSPNSKSRTSLPKPSPPTKENPKRTPPKVPSKPNLFNRKDTVQPSPTPRPALHMAGTTKTQTLREKSITRGGFIRSSTSSNSSVTSKTSTTSRTSMRTSSSSHSLRSASDSAPKRVPSSSDIERRKSYLNSGRPTSPLYRRSPPTAVAKPISSMSPLEPVKKAGPKKNVTSKIASLWKKVEDSKQKSDAEKSAKKYKPKDKRVWISKGKTQSEEKESPAPAPGKLIRSGTYEKINGDQTQTQKTPAAKTEEIKPRSRSRLSMKLSKFSLKRRGTGSMEDQVNGNTPVSPDEPLSPTDDLGNSISVLSPNESELMTPDDTNRPTSVSPNLESGDSMSTGPDEVRIPSQPRTHNSSTFRSPNRSPASAIVAPFNYIPSSSATQLKRNTSYVSSIGRKNENVPPIDDSEGEKKLFSSQTSSTMVTLV